MTAPARPAPWLFPATYLLHAAEEYCCGETFPVWISELGGVQFTASEFLWLNGAAMAAMVAAVLLIGRRPGCHWLVATLGTVVVVNGALHTAGSLATWTYSPGLVTGMLLWLPLGVLALRAAWRELPRGRFALGVAAGLLAHALVSGAVLL